MLPSWLSLFEHRFFDRATLLNVDDYKYLKWIYIITANVFDPRPNRIRYVVKLTPKRKRLQVDRVLAEHTDIIQHVNLILLLTLQSESIFYSHPLRRPPISAPLHHLSLFLGKPKLPVVVLANNNVHS